MADDDPGDTAGADGVPDGGPDGTDPFEGLTLDEDFIRGAAVTEESADQRMARVARIEAEHRRLAAEREIQRTELDRTLRRNARRQRRAAEGSPTRQRFVVIGVMLAVFAGLVWWNMHDHSGSVALGAGGLLGSDATGGSVASSAHPPAGVDEQAQPLGEPAPLVTESDAFAFVATQADSDEPVAYDPCREVHVVVNERTVIGNGGVIVQEALETTSQATGLQFVVDGVTDERPSDTREVYQPDRYGKQWAPVLIAWSDTTETPGLVGDIAGLGGSAWVETAQGTVYVSGQISLDGPDLARIQLQEGAAGVRAVIEHELGHLVGLDHVNDPTQLMNPEGDGSVVTYAAGDLAGLSRLGQGACFPRV